MRVIQVAVVITLIVLCFGLFDVWQRPELPTGENPGSVQTPPGGTGGTPAGDPGTVGSGTEAELTNNKIVCFGDSYTMGYPGAIEDSWPAVLQNLLKVEVINKGMTGQPSYNLLQRFDADVVTENPGRVIILAGNGDALDNGGRPLEDFQRDMTALVDKAIASHIKPILIVPIPYKGSEPKIKEYSDWLRTFATERQITLLDFKEILCGGQEELLKQYAASENDHYPNKEGYAAMANYVYGVLK
jgi:lysophospholipase L1-like esterase